MIYAKIIPPEESDYEFKRDANLLYEPKIYIGGNHHFCGINDDGIEEAKKLFDDFDSHYSHDSSYYRLTDEQFLELSKIFEQEKSWGEIEDEFVLKCLEFKNGVPYKRVTIYGFRKGGDWNNLYAPSDMTQSQIGEIETYYFNLGTEVCIEDSDKELRPEEIRRFSVYFPTWGPHEIKRRIAEYAGVDVSDVVLYEFDGYVKTPKYKKAQ